MATKRLNYFDGQYLDENDFKNEQQYHIDALKSHNKNLHDWGIAHGLDVEFDTGKKFVIVNEGMAVDNNGRQMVVEKSIEIDLATSTESTVYLTISYRETETDSKEEEGIEGKTRITEEPRIEYGAKKPDDPSIKIFLAKVTLNPENKVVKAVDKSERKIIGISQDIKAKSVSFILPTDSDKWPKMKGFEDGNLEISSKDTILSGDLEVNGTIRGNLENDIVGNDQIKDESISASKFSFIRSVNGSGDIDENGEREIKFKPPDPKEPHLYIASVIPEDPDSSIEWSWMAKRKKDGELGYRLKIKNLSDKKIKFSYVCYDILYSGVHTRISPVNSKLVLLHNKREIELTQDEMEFGKNDFEGDISEEDSNYITRKEGDRYHFKIIMDEGKFYILDEYSTNGTKLKNKDIKGKGRQELKDRDVITLANNILQLEFRKD